MIRKRFLLAAAFISAVLVCGLRAGDEESYFDSLMQGPTQWEMKLRVMEGQREGAGDPARAVTASYARSMTTIGYLSAPDLSGEQGQIRKTFNLKEVRLLTETDLVWAEGKAGKTSHTFRLNGWEYVVKVTTGEKRAGNPSASKSSKRRRKGRRTSWIRASRFRKRRIRPSFLDLRTARAGRSSYACTRFP